MSDNMTEKYQAHYNKLLNGTFGDLIVKSISYQANIQLANDIISEQETTIKDLTKELKELKDTKNSSENSKITELENQVKANTGIINRLQSDLNEANSYFEVGDILKVEVRPYDGYKTGLTYTSNQFSFVDKFVPYVKDVQIKSSSSIHNNSTSVNSTLTAYYSFTDQDGSSDQSVVNWYDWKTNSMIHTGSSLGSTYLQVGQAISFVVRPYDGEYYGQSVESQIINII